MAKQTPNGKKAYTWSTHGSFKVGLRETDIFIKSISGSLELKLDYTSSAARHIKEFHENGKNSELERYIKYLFTSIMLFGDSDYFLVVVDAMLKHVEKMQIKSEDEPPQELSGDSE